MGTITFNGVTSTSLGIKVWTAPEYTTPEKDVTSVHIPGRSGDILIDNGVYKNTTRSYQVSLYNGTSDYAALSHVIANWVHSANGYKRLEDTYDSLYYRQAVYVEAMQFTNVHNKAATATITFSCKPQRFLKSGETQYDNPTALQLKNDTNFTARPKITVTKSSSAAASFDIGGVHVAISSGSPTTITIDSMLMDCYYSSGNVIQNGNAYVSFTKNNLPAGFPTLPPGSNSITNKTNISTVKVVPNWWTI